MGAEQGKRRRCLEGVEEAEGKQMRTAREIAMEATGGIPISVAVDHFHVKQQQDYAFKKNYARVRAWEFYQHPDVNGDAFVAVGGLDSITLYVFLRSIGIDVPAVSVSFLEDKSIQKVHKALGVKSLSAAKDKTGKPYTKVQIIKDYGYPVISKEVAAKITMLQNPSEKNATARHAAITGEMGARGEFKKSEAAKMSKKWLELFAGSDPEGCALGYKAAPFKVSDKCCYYLKEKPCDDYAKKSGRYPYMGLMASEGGRRARMLKIHGCNYFSPKTKRSAPFAIFMRDDLLRLAQEMDAWYHEHWQEFSDTHIDSIIPEIYGEIVEGKDGKLMTTGAQRTGCSICCFGIHMEKRPHRFDQLRERNPKEWAFWMYDMGFGDVLSYIGVEWESRIDGQLDGQVSMFEEAGRCEDGTD